MLGLQDIDLYCSCRVSARDSLLPVAIESFRYLRSPTITERYYAVRLAQLAANCEYVMYSRMHLYTASVQHTCPWLRPSISSGVPCYARAMKCNRSHCHLRLDARFYAPKFGSSAIYDGTRDFGSLIKVWIWRQAKPHMFAVP